MVGMQKATKIIKAVVAALIILLTLFNTVLVIYITMTLRSFFGDFYLFFPGMEPRGLYVKIDDVGYVDYDSCLIDPDKLASGEEIKTYTWSEIMEYLDAVRAEADSSISEE